MRPTGTLLVELSSSVTSNFPLTAVSATSLRSKCSFSLKLKGDLIRISMVLELTDLISMVSILSLNALFDVPKPVIENII